MSTPRTIDRSQPPLKPLAACLTLSMAATSLICPSIAAAATLPVTNCDDAGSGSLRATLASAVSGDSVDLTALTCAKITLATGHLLVTVDDLTLQGPGESKLTIAASQVPGHDHSVLQHNGAGTLHVDALRITGGSVQQSSEYTAQCVWSAGTVALDHSTVTGCTRNAVAAKAFLARASTISDSYQGVFTTDGSVSIYDSTISGNRSYQRCVGVRFAATLPGAKTLIVNSTISNNSSFYANYYYGPNTSISGSGAGCIYGPVTISNSTIAFNSATHRAFDVGSLVISSNEATIESSIFAHNSALDLTAGYAPFAGHHNVIMNTVSDVPADTIRADPQLLPLADNGGPTRTHALAAGSPAIDAGSNPTGLATDQRGSPFARLAGAGTDIGAFELQPASGASVAIGPGFTGSWFDPTQSGHGLMLEVLSDHRVLAMWFAFNPEGTQQAWFGGVGTYNGATATITDVALPTGGRWIPNFDPNAIVRNPWGTLTLTFTDCNHGKADFSSVRGYGSGSMNLLRLTQPAGLACP